MLKKKTKANDFVKLFREQDSIARDAASLEQQFEESNEGLVVIRFRICILIFICLLPLLGIVDYYTLGFTNPVFSLTLRGVMILILSIYAFLTFIPQFRKSIYAFVFILVVILGFYNLAIIVYEGTSAFEHYIFYGLVFSILGLVLPWDAKAIMGVCLPVYILYPVGIAVMDLPMTGNYFIKSNLYLLCFMLIVIVGAAINHSYRFQEFVLKKREESLNQALEDFQTRLKRSYERMENLAVIDHLTGVYNRTYLTQWLTMGIHKNPQKVKVFSMIMYDLDHFKEINDIGGHQIGDRVLQRATEIVQELLPEGAPIFRYGGDEFCIILPGFDLRRGVQKAEAIRSRVAEHSDLLIKLSPVESVRLTISMGVIEEFVTGSIDADYLIRWVDAALLESKRQGRNCIHVFDSESRKIVSAAPWLGNSS
ncbi:MAG: diguanylate cyclase [Candidatus Omnitrophica bacterium]|nr:diguanylate cyclase [Candidatus Omnitrophota bacterium]